MTSSANGTGAVVAPDLLLDRFAKNVSRYGGKELFSFLGPGLDGGRVQKSYTYGSFDAESSVLARRLVVDGGLRQGDRALLVYPPSLDFMVTFFACAKVGVVPVPVFPPNPSRKDTLRMFGAIARSSGSKVALTNREYDHLKKLASVKDVLTRSSRKSPGGGSWPDDLKWMTTDAARSGTSDNNGNDYDVTIEPQDIAFLQYTSGSTSEPKGVMITHGNLAHNLTIITNELKAGEGTVVTSWLPQYHDMGLIGSYLGVAYCGGKGYYLSPLSFLQRPMIWIEAASKHGATHCQAPNFAFKLTSRKFRADDYVNKPLDLSSLRHVINAAEPVDEVGMKAFLKAFGPFGLRDVIFPTYGLAEHTVFVCSGGRQVITVDKRELEVDGRVVVLEDAAADDDDAATSRLVGCGYPARQAVDVRIVDREARRSLPEGTVGEIWVSSPSKAGGYFRKPDETEAEFFAALEGDDDGDGNDDGAAPRFLRTGDLGFLLNGELFVCGRLKDLIIVGGRNYYPQDLEATAESAATDRVRPGCSAAFAIDPTPRTTGGRGGEEVALVMELREVPSERDVQDACNPLADSVRAAVNGEHSLGVRRVVFVRPKTVPKTTSGKIARSWCRKAHAGGTLKVVFEKSYAEGGAAASPFEVEQSSSPSGGAGGGGGPRRKPPPTAGEIEELRSKSRDEIRDMLRADVSKVGQIPPDCIDDDTALITLLDSLSLSEFKGGFESGYAVRVSDEYLFREDMTLTKLAEVAKAGYAADDDGIGGGGGGPQSSVATTNQGSAGGLAGMLGCPPGVYCAIQ